MTLGIDTGRAKNRAAEERVDCGEDLVVAVDDILEVAEVVLWRSFLARAVLIPKVHCDGAVIQPVPGEIEVYLVAAVAKDWEEHHAVEALEQTTESGASLVK